jgi:hypothetical protein
MKAEFVFLLEARADVKDKDRSRFSFNIMSIVDCPVLH